MRLGQISRKLDIPTKKVKEMVEDHFKIELDSDLNTKLNDEHIEWLADQFKEEPETTSNDSEEKLTEMVAQSDVPDNMLSEEVNSQVETSSEETESETPEVIETEEKEEVKQETKESIEVAPTPLTETENKKVIQVKRGEKISTSADPDSEFYELDENTDVIRAPKVSIEGIKVLGKIDLPEPKIEEPKDEETSTDGVIESDSPESSDENKTKSYHDRRNSNGRGRNRNNKRNKGKESHEQRQKRLDKEAKRKKQKEEAEAKERRRQNYLSKIQDAKDAAAQKKKAKNKKSAQVSEYQQRINDMPEAKGIFGKIWRWLNT